MHPLAAAFLAEATKLREGLSRQSSRGGGSAPDILLDFYVPPPRAAPEEGDDDDIEVIDAGRGPAKPAAPVLSVL